jgi:uncharacterized integral membrane protein
VSEAPDGSPSTGPRIPPWKLVLWVVVALYALLLLLLNNRQVPVRFLFFTVNTNLVWLILLSMALGAALAVIVPRWRRSRKPQ